MIVAGLPLLAACNSEDEAMQGNQPLQVSVTAGVSASRAVVHGSYLAEGSQIGLSLTADDGSAYDGQSYVNVPFQVTGDGSNTAQSWSCTGQTVPSLSTTYGKAVAYWPYNPDVTDLTAIPVDAATQTDYMYSGWYGGLSMLAPKANLLMKHALAVFAIKFVGYGTDVAATVTLVSDMFGSTGVLDATTGTLSGIGGKDTGVSLTPVAAAEVDNSSENEYVEVFVVPDESVTSGTVTATVVTTGGSTLTFTLELSEPVRQGGYYPYTLYGAGPN